MRAAMLSCAAACVGLLGTGCTTASHAQAPPLAKVTQAQALRVLDEVSANAATTHRFCVEQTRSAESCEMVMEQAREFCLAPGPKPVVKASVEVPTTKGDDGYEYEGGWKLTVEGRTAGGQRYVSDFVVVATEEGPRADIGVYWTGLGRGQSMEDQSKDQYTVLPQSECADGPQP